MRKLSWFTAGVITLAITLCASVIIFLKTQAASFSEQPSVVERWAAQRFRALAVPLSVREGRNPVPDAPEELAKARAHWADHCASCHANDGSGDMEMGKHLYPPAPDMWQAATQTLTDGELLYIIRNGIRFSGMPAWGERFDQGRRGFLETGALHSAPSGNNFRRGAGNERAKSEKPRRIRRRARGNEISKWRRTT